MSCRVAVLGVGSMGRQHARIYQELGEAGLVAVADADADRAEEVAAMFGCRAYADYVHLLDKEELDAVSVALPTSLHVEAGELALEAGLHVLVEKPLAGDVVGAERLAATATRVDRVLSVGHVERFNPAVRELKRRIDRGEFGKVTSIIARRVGVFPPRMDDTNVVIDFAIHDIDICNYLMGRAPLRINATGGKARTGGGIDYSEIFLDYGDAGCFIQANWITPIKIRKLTVTGTVGYGELDYITQALDLYQPSDAGSVGNFDELQDHYGLSRVTVAPVEQQEPLKLELASFLAHLRDGSGEIVPAREAVEALRIAEIALEQVTRARV